MKLSEWYTLVMKLQEFASWNFVPRDPDIDVHNVEYWEVCERSKGGVVVALIAVDKKFFGVLARTPHGDVYLQPASKWQVRKVFQDDPDPGFSLVEGDTLNRALTEKWAKYYRENN